MERHGVGRHAGGERHGRRFAHGGSRSRRAAPGYGDYQRRPPGATWAPEAKRHGRQNRRVGGFVRILGRRVRAGIDWACSRDPPAGLRFLQNRCGACSRPVPPSPGWLRRRLGRKCPSRPPPGAVWPHLARRGRTLSLASGGGWCRRRDIGGLDTLPCGFDSDRIELSDLLIPKHVDDFRFEYGFKTRGGHQGAAAIRIGPWRRGCR